ncbi:extracellular calcium-sensing receptor-like [Pleurodeles waltl]|uniref:extracellular calcium-sensing receptor-like n=1 Tax=Pleurodeles waltl TaxID=8319 RepID=UPI0037098761
MIHQSQSPCIRNLEQEVSFYSSGLVFSNKVLFPSFFRTIPSTVHQAHGLAQLVLHFGWTWVGLLYSSDDYGLEGFKILNKVLQNSGVCLAFQENLPDPSPYITQKTSRILEVIRSSSANVIIAFTPGHYLHILFTEYSKYKITGRTWISTEAWSVPAYLPSVIARPFAGTIGFAIYEGEMPGFKSFLQKVSPFTFPNDPFVQLFWETAFSCQWPKDEGNGMLANSQLNTSKAFCTGTEKMEQANLQYLDDSDLRINYNVYNAVYAVATALREMKSCEPGHGPFPNYTCADLENINPWQEENENLCLRKELSVYLSSN